MQLIRGSFFLSTRYDFLFRPRTKTLATLDSDPLARAAPLLSLLAAASVALLLASIFTRGGGGDAVLAACIAFAAAARSEFTLQVGPFIRPGVSDQEPRLATWRWLALALAFLCAVAALLRRAPATGRRGVFPHNPPRAGTLERRGSAGPSGGECAVRTI